MKLQARLAITVALAAAIAIVVMATAFWVLSANQQRGDVDAALVRFVSEPRPVLAALRESDEGRLAPGFGSGFEDVAEERLFTRLLLVVDGSIEIDHGLPEVSGMQANAEPAVSTIEIDGERFRMAVAPWSRGQRSGIIQAARNIEDLEAGLVRLRRQIVAASLACIALAGLLGALVARRLSAPITKVANAAREMSSGSELPSPIDVNRSDEVGELATSFNQMLSALELSREQQQRLVADASHELRTPLTSLRIKLDLLDSRPDLPEGQRQELLSTSALEVERLGELVTELVVLATDPTGVEEDVVEHSLVSIVGAVVSEHEQRSGRSITVHAPNPDVLVAVRERMTRRAVSNLIDNAVKYSSESSPIVVSVDGVNVEVRDEGEGIPRGDLPHVFDRFYRSTSARTRPGNGIGLAIVNRVAEVHGGRTWAHNVDDPGGAVVGFSVG